MKNNISSQLPAETSQLPTDSEFDVNVETEEKTAQKTTGPSSIMADVGEFLSIMGSVKEKDFGIGIIETVVNSTLHPLIALLAIGAGVFMEVKKVIN